MSTAPPNALDLRPLPDDRKFPPLLAAFRNLEAGDSFVFVDDCDPSELRARIEDERLEAAQWVALEEGPPVWCVRIGRPLRPDIPGSSA
jgi:uncharacterized protein (DUF2249 family)